jgi:hypothetical protein
MKAAGGTNSKQVTTWARYNSPEHRALSTDAEFLEVWSYDMEQLPRGIAYPRVDVHYVTKRGAGKYVLQPNTVSRHTIATARRQAGPRRRS